MAAVTLLATACAAAPAPSPTPTPTGFASEEEAFAAAEETYRAYVEALNAANLQDAETLEPVYGWLTDDALAATREEFTTMTANGWTKSGSARVELVELAPGTFTGRELAVLSCHDVSEVTVVDPDGNSVVAPDRPDVQPLRIEFAWSEATDTAFRISRVTGRDGEPACS